MVAANGTSFAAGNRAGARGSAAQGIYALFAAAAPIAAAHGARRRGHAFLTTMAVAVTMIASAAQNARRFAIVGSILGRNGYAAAAAAPAPARGAGAL